MVSLRCKMIVETELNKFGLHYGVVDLGEVEVQETLTTEHLDNLKAALLTSGLELMDDKKTILIEKIKNVIVAMVHQADQQLKLKNSDYISQKLNHDYTYLANLFSESTGITIEHYIIAHKIEKVKELLLYDELTPDYWTKRHLTLGRASNQTLTCFKNRLKSKIRALTS